MLDKWSWNKILFIALSGYFLLMKGTVLSPLTSSSRRNYDAEGINIISDDAELEQTFIIRLTLSRNMMHFYKKQQIIQCSRSTESEYRILAIFIYCGDKNQQAIWNLLHRNKFLQCLTIITCWIVPLFRPHTFYFTTDGSAKNNYLIIM